MYIAYDNKKKEFIDLTKDTYALDVEGNLVKYGVGHNELQEEYFDDVEVFHYTGVTDKNGVKIYEKSILDLDIGLNNIIQKALVLRDGAVFGTVCSYDGVDFSMSDAENENLNDIRNWVEVVGHYCEDKDILKFEY